MATLARPRVSAGSLSGIRLGRGLDPAAGLMHSECLACVSMTSGARNLIPPGPVVELQPQPSASPEEPAQDVGNLAWGWDRPVVWETTSLLGGILLAEAVGVRFSYGGSAFYDFEVGTVFNLLVVALAAIPAIHWEYSPVFSAALAAETVWVGALLLASFILLPSLAVLLVGAGGGVLLCVGAIRARGRSESIGSDGETASS